MTSKSTTVLGKQVFLKIPETIEEVEHMLGKNWMQDAAMCFHYRHTLPILREKYLREVEQKTGKQRNDNETEASFVKRALNLK